MLKRLSVKVLSSRTTGIISSLGSRLAPVFHLSNSSLGDPPFPVPPFPALSAYRVCGPYAGSQVAGQATM